VRATKVDFSGAEFEDFIYQSAMLGSIDSINGCNFA